MIKKIERYFSYGINWVFHYLLSCFYQMIFPMQNNKVFFVSDTRKKLGGNLKSVYDYLNNKNFERVVDLHEDKLLRRTLKEEKILYYHLATSRYILLDDLCLSVSFMRLRKKQEVIQLWHGPGAFKKMGISRQDYKNSLLSHFSGHRNYTKVIVTSPNIEWCYREAFGMKKDGAIKATGFPRTDNFFDSSYIQNTKSFFYQNYPNLKDKKIILFAPTYRGEKISDATYDFSKLDFKKIYDKFHEDYVFIIKWHPAIYNNISKQHINFLDLKKYNGFYLDFSQYHDINDLLIVCDILVTDYSSVIFDYVLLNKPIVYYVYDLDIYNEKRGLYYNFSEYVYGEISKDCDELIKSIQIRNLLPEKREKFYQQFMSECDGYSTMKTCQWIFGEEENN